MTSKNHKKRKLKIVLIVTIVAILCVDAVVLAVWSIGRSNTKQTNNDVKYTTKTEVKPQATALSSNMLVLGNSFWGRSIDEWSQKSPLKYAYPFSRLNEFHRDKYDAWISGLECPMDEDVHMTAAQQEVNLQFNCPPEYTAEAAKWFTAFTLANNHTDNQGAEGFTKTQKHLEEKGIQYFGNYDPKVIDDTCEVVDLPVTIQLDNGNTKKGDLPVAMCGYHGVFQIPPAAGIELMQKYSKYMLTFAFPHMGLEYKPAPDQLKINTYHSMIDNGADVVFGDHPHWIQNTEAYKGHLIVYSMGNFMFDQQGTSEVTRSAGINLLLKTKDADAGNLQKWLDLGKECKKYKDDCLEKAEKQGLVRPKFTFEFNIVGTSDAGKIVKPATDAEQQAILARLNWQAVKPKIQSEY